MGYDVRVIHTSAYYPRLYYKIPRWLRNFLQDIVGFALPESRLNQELTYDYEGVKVYRIPMFKVMPMRNYTEKVLKKACRKADRYIQENKFQPEHIISHWHNPQLAMMSFLKERIGAKATLVLHGCPSKLDRLYSDGRKMFGNVDVWGFRSLRIKREFEQRYGEPRFSFICFSGIPSSFTIKPIVRDGSFHDRYSRGPAGNRGDFHRQFGTEKPGLSVPGICGAVLWKDRTVDVGYCRIHRHCRQPSAQAESMIGRSRGRGMMENQKERMQIG